MKWMKYVVVCISALTLFASSGNVFAMPTNNNAQISDATKNIVLKATQQKKQIKIGEVLDHDFLSQYVAYEDGSDITDYVLIPEFIKGESHFKDNVAISEGKAKIRIALKDKVTGEILPTDLCFSICIVEDTPSEIIEHIPYIYGYEDGTFRPERHVTREELASMISRLIQGGTEKEVPQHYTDLSPNRYSSKSVGYLSQLGIMAGYDDGTFRPQQPVSHDEMRAVIERTQAYLEKEQQTVMARIYRGVDATLTRAEAVVVLNELFDRQCENIKVANPYRDLIESDWGYEAILCSSIWHEHTLTTKNL